MGAKSLTRPAASLYDEDFVLWTAETARLLRAGRFEQIDVEHLAEEIEDMGKRDRRELSSRLTVLVVHLLKWQLQSEKRSRSWKSTLVTERTELQQLFDQSPSLRRSVPDSIARMYPYAIKQTATESGLPLNRFPQQCPYSAEQILDLDFLPN